MRPSKSSEALWAAVLALAAVALAAVAFTRPVTTAGASGAPYQQRVTFDYATDVTPNVVYPDGKVRWGDPVYAKLVSKVAIRVTYQLTGPISSTHGFMSIKTELSAANGWDRTLPASAPVAVWGNTATAATMLDLDELRRMSEEFQGVTGVPLGELTVKVTADVSAETTVHGEVARPKQSAPLEFRFNGSALTLADAATSPSIDSGKSAEARPQANKVSIVGRRIPVLWCRLAVAPLALAALVAFVLAIQARRRRAGPVTAELNHRYRGRLVEVNNLDRNEPGVELVSADDFFRVADPPDTTVLHAKSAEGEVYVVVKGSIRYRYVVPGSFDVAEDYLKRIDAHTVH